MFWKNGVKTCPADEFSPSCEKASNSVAYKLCVCTRVKTLCGAKIRSFYCRWLLKKQSTTTKKHFSSSKSNLSVNAGRTTANGQTERETRLYTQPNDTLLYPIGAARHVKRSTENCGFVTLQHPKAAPANGGNELNGFARKRASFSDPFWNWGGGHTTTDFFQHSA